MTLTLQVNQPHFDNVAPTATASTDAPTLFVDKAAHEAAVNGRPIQLTLKEFGLLAYFWEHRGQALSREQLLAGVWGSGYTGGPRTVDIHIRRLRRKLGQAFDLVTLRGVGYKLPGAFSRVPESSTQLDSASVHH